MFRSKPTIAAGLIALTVTGATIAPPVEADAHPLLFIVLAAGAIGTSIGVIATAHPNRTVVVDQTPRDPVVLGNCHYEQRITHSGVVRTVEVCPQM